MKKYVIAIGLIMIVVVLAGCAGGGAATGGMKEIITPYSELEDLRNDMVSNGTIAVIGQGQSQREDLARDKARQDGMQKLASALEAEVNGYVKQFKEEIGSDSDSEINDSFQRVNSTLTKSVLRGAMSKKSKLTHNGKSGKESRYEAYVIMAIDSKAVLQSFQDEMKKEDVLYTRYRHSQMNTEMEEKLKGYGKD